MQIWLGMLLVDWLEMSLGTAMDCGEDSMLSTSGLVFLLERVIGLGLADLTGYWTVLLLQQIKLYSVGSKDTKLVDGEMVRTNNNNNLTK